MAFPQLHPRHRPVVAAKMKLESFMMDLQKEFELTPSEVFSLLGQQVAREASWCIVGERQEPDEEVCR